MKTKTWSRRGLCLAAVCLAGAVVADERPSGLTGGERVNVSLTLLASWNGGATSAVATFGPFPLAVGETLRPPDLPPFAFGAAGKVPGGCGAEVGTNTPTTVLTRQLYAWTANATVLEASTDRLALSATWKRFTRGPDGTPVDSAAESIPTVSLREGERVLLDYVVPSAASRPCARNYALELTAALQESPELAHKQIGYDVWLVHETGDGQKQTSRTQLTAGQGEQLEFAFPRQSVPALASGAKGDETLQVTVTGTVRGRVNPDGGLELSLRTQRSLSYLAPDGSNDGGIGDGGDKFVRVQPDEVVRIELPSPAEGPAREDPRALRMRQDLAGHSFALVLIARAI